MVELVCLAFGCKAVFEGGDRLDAVSLRVVGTVFLQRMICEMHVVISDGIRAEFIRLR